MGYDRSTIVDRKSKKVRLLRSKCSTCIYRPGNKMHLQEGRVEEMTERNVQDGSWVTCHKTLPWGENPEFGEAICRGFYDVHGHRSLGVRMARVMTGFEEVTPPGETSSKPSVFAMVTYLITKMELETIHRDVIRAVLPFGVIRMTQGTGVRIVKIDGQSKTVSRGRNIVSERYQKALRALEVEEVIERGPLWVVVKSHEKVKEWSDRAEATLDDLDLERALRAALKPELKSQYRKDMRRKEILRLAALIEERSA